MNDVQCPCPKQKTSPGLARHAAYSATHRASRASVEGSWLQPKLLSTNLRLSPFTLYPSLTHPSSERRINYLFPLIDFFWRHTRHPKKPLKLLHVPFVPIRTASSLLDIQSHSQPVLAITLDCLSSPRSSRPCLTTSQSVTHSSASRAKDGKNLRISRDKQSTAPYDKDIFIFGTNRSQHASPEHG